MNDYELRFKGNYRLGTEFEDWFSEMTKPLEGIIRASDKYSVYDFKYGSTAIELKQRRYTFESFNGLLITVNKFDRLRQFNRAIYVNRFEDNRVYVCNLKTINFPLEQSTYRADTGYTTINYTIPSASFERIQSRSELLSYIQEV